MVFSNERKIGGQEFRTFLMFENIHKVTLRVK